MENQFYEVKKEFYFVQILLLITSIMREIYLPAGHMVYLVS